MKITKAMILCAGFGKRLRPLTLYNPKPLLKIGNKTLLSNTLNILEQFGIKQVVINVHYLGDQIIEYIKKNKFNVAYMTGPPIGALCNSIFFPFPRSIS